MNYSLFRCQSCGTGNRVPYSKLHLSSKCGRCGEGLSGETLGTVHELDDAALDTAVRETTIPLLVDFYSPTCGPCQAFAPVIEDIARNFAGRVLVVKIDTSRFQRNAATYQVRGVPTLIIFKHGKIAEQIVGAASREQINQVLETHV